MTRILVVDDEPDIASSIQVGLRRKGFEVECYTSPKEALSHYSRGFYDMMIADIRMPEMDGYELAREIRKIDPDVKVRFLTAFDIPKGELEKSFPEMEYSQIMQKPMLIGQLVTAIKTALASVSKSARSNALAP